MDGTDSKIARIIEIVNHSEISTIKQTVMQIVKTINDPDSGAKDLKDIIEKDPPLTARLLRLANSALYGYPKTIGGIQEAIVCIGFDAVRELALSQKVCELFQKELAIDGYTRLSLWRHSVAVALCSQLLYRREFTERGNNMYVAGLLHDIGIVIIDQFMHAEFREIMRHAREEQQNLTHCEETRIGFDHAMLGGAIAENWEFPDEIRTAIAAHHHPDTVADTYAKIASTLFVSNYAVQSNHIGYSDAQYGDQTAYQACLVRLGIQEKAVELIINEVEQEIRKMEKAGWF